MTTPLQQLAADLADVADTLAEIRAVLEAQRKAGREVVRLELATDIDDDADLLRQILLAVETA